MSKFFKSRCSETRKHTHDDGAQVKRNLEQEIEKEVAVMSVAMPFLPKDQVRGVVLKKLGLQNGKNKNTLLRKGGGRIEFKNISLEFPQSWNYTVSTSIQSPRNIRKKLLGRSQIFGIIGHPPTRRNTSNQENTALNDNFDFSHASPIDNAPRPYERTHKRRPRKTSKRRLYTISEDEDDWRLSHPAKPCRSNIFSSTPNISEATQLLRGNQEPQIQPVVREPLSETCRGRPERLDSVEQTAAFTNGSSGDPSSPLSPASQNSAVESDHEGMLEEDNLSPVFNVKLSTRFKSRCGTVVPTTSSTTNKPIGSEVKNKISLKPETETLFDKLSLSKKSTADRQIGRLTLSGAPRNTSPIPAISVTPTTNQSNKILEIAQSPEEMTDLAVVPSIASDAASTSITPPAENYNAHNVLVTETQSEAVSTRNSPAVPAGSDVLPGISLSSKEYYSATPQTPVIAMPREASPASHRQSSFNSALASASQTLGRQEAASQRDSPEEISEMESSFQRSLTLQDKNSLARSGTSSRALHNNERDSSTSESEGPVTPRGQSPLRSDSTTSESASPWAALGRTSAGNSAENQDYSHITPQSESAVAPRELLDSINTTPQSALPEPLATYRNEGSYVGNATHYSPIKGSSAEIVSCQDNRTIWSSSSTVSSGNAYETSLNFSIKPVKTRMSPSSSTTSTPQSASYRKEGTLAGIAAPVRDPSSWDLSWSGGSNTRGERRVSADSSKASSTSSIENNHAYFSPKSTQFVNPIGSPSPGSKSTTPQSVSQEPLRPYQKKGRYEGDAAHDSPERGSYSENISCSNGSKTQAERSLQASSGKAYSGSSIEKAHSYCSPKSVEPINPKESSSGSKSQSPLRCGQNDRYQENATLCSTKYQNQASPGNKSFHSSISEDTPTSTKPSYSLFRKGIPRINQVPDQNMTARRMVFHSEYLAESFGLSQEKDPEKPALSQDPFSLSDQTIEISTSELDNFLDSLKSRKQISVTPLLLKKGADRLDGLPFPSGEAMRPFTAEWLHQKKLGSQTDSTPTKPVFRPRTSSRNLNDWRSIESSLVPVRRRANSQTVPPSQATISPLFTGDECLSMEVTQPVPVTTSQAHSSLKAGDWWKESSVLRALSQLGVEELLKTDTSEIQLTTRTDQSSSPNRSLSQESNVQRITSILSSPERNVEDSSPESVNRTLLD